MYILLLTNNLIVPDVVIVYIIHVLSYAYESIVVFYEIKSSINMTSKRAARQWRSSERGSKFIRLT